MVERDILLEDDDQVLDWRRSIRFAAIPGEARSGKAGSNEQTKPGPGDQAGSRHNLTASSHRLSPKLPRIWRGIRTVMDYAVVTI
jgi:ABC-type uncharacterized transport system involved in gliding motility auxiliary subunit